MRFVEAALDGDAHGGTDLDYDCPRPVVVHDLDRNELRLKFVFRIATELRGPIRERRNRDPALLGELPEGHAATCSPLEQAHDVRT